MIPSAQWLTASSARELEAGQEIATFTYGPVTMDMIKSYATASNDHNPIHLDSAEARDAGLPDVIAHGMLSMGVLSRLVTGCAPASAIREIQARFISMVGIGAVLHCSAWVVALTLDGDSTRLEVGLSARDGKGKEFTTGAAKIWWVA